MVIHYCSHTACVRVGFIWADGGERERGRDGVGEAVSISRRLMSTDRLTHSRDNPESDLSPTHYQEPDQQNGRGVVRGEEFILH